jgi:hypothetical protein
VADPGPITQRIQVEAEDAIRDTKRFADGTKEVGDASKDAGGKLKQTTETLKDQNNEWGNGDLALSGFTRGLVGILSAGAPVLAFLRQLKAELQQVIDLQDKALPKQLELASEQRSLRLNLAGESEATIQRAEAAALDISNRRGVPLPFVYAALGATVSAQGGDLESSIPLVDLAASVRPDQPGDIAGISGALGDIGKAIKSRDALLDLGYLNKVGSLSRVADPAQQFRTIPGAITGVAGLGFARGEAGALFAALSNAAAEETGAPTSTASIKFAGDLEKFFVEQQRPERGAAAIRALQSDAALREQFLGGFSSEQRFIVPLRDLVSSGQSATAQQFEKFVPQFGSDADLRQQAETTLRNLNAGEVQTTAAVSRNLSVGIQNLQLSDVRGGRVAAVRKDLVELLNNAGLSNLGGKLASLDFEASAGVGSGDPVQEAIRLIEDQKKDLLHPVETFSAGVGAPPTILRRFPGAEDYRKVAALDLVLKQLSAVRPLPAPSRPTYVPLAGDVPGPQGVPGAQGVPGVGGEAGGAVNITQHVTNVANQFGVGDPRVDDTGRRQQP